MKQLANLILFVTCLCLSSCGDDELKKVKGAIQEMNDLATMEVEVQKVIAFDTDDDASNFGGNNFDFLESIKESIKKKFGRQVAFLPVKVVLVFGYDTNEIDVQEEGDNLVVSLPKLPKFLWPKTEDMIDYNNVRDYNSGIYDKIGDTKLRKIKNTCENEIIDKNEEILESIKTEIKPSAEFAIACILAKTKWGNNYIIKEKDE